jgi:hypothetical protein
MYIFRETKAPSPKKYSLIFCLLCSKRHSEKRESRKGKDDVTIAHYEYDYIWEVPSQVQISRSPEIDLLSQGQK